MSLELELWDTSGQEDYNRLRPLSYPDTNVFLVCFSVGSPEEQQQIKRRWAPEAKHFCPGVPLILVGIEPAERKVSLDIASERRQGLDLAGKVGALTYIQCNPEANKGVEDVLHAVGFPT
jgi:small GTP-binding protein